MTKNILPRIEVLTQLHPDVRHRTDPETIIEGGYRVNARNTLRAAREMVEAKKDSVRTRGSIGAGRTWAVLIQADGSEVNITKALYDVLNSFNGGERLWQMQWAGTPDGLARYGWSDVDLEGRPDGVAAIVDTL